MITATYHNMLNIVNKLFGGLGSNNLKKYDAIIPCGIKDKGVTNLYEIKNQNYSKLKDKIIKIKIDESLSTLQINKSINFVGNN